MTVSLHKGPIVRGLSLLLILFLGVVGLETTGRAYMHLKYGVPGKSYGRWRSDAVLGARMAENVYDHRWQTNDRGFRNDEDLIEPKPPNAWRTIAYGGSATLCWNLPTPETWPARLEQLLREETGCMSHQVLNAGDILWSLGLVHARARIEIPELRPDFVILYTGINEVWNAMLLEHEGRPIEELFDAGEYGVFSQRLPQCGWLARESLVYKVVHKYIIAPITKRLRSATGRKWARLLVTDLGPESPPDPPDPDILQNYLHVLDDLITLCKKYDATPLFVVQAYGSRTVGLDHFTSYSREGAKLAEWSGDLFRESGIHYSALGAEMLAERIFVEQFLPVIEGNQEGDSVVAAALSW